MLTREWRNWQTRTFEGRVVTPYGFKSRFSHQKQKDGKSRPFCFSYKLTTPNPSNSQELDCFAQEFLYTLVYGAQSWVLKSRFFLPRNRQRRIRQPLAADGRRCPFYKVNARQCCARTTRRYACVAGSTSSRFSHHDNRSKMQPKPNTFWWNLQVFSIKTAAPESAAENNLFQLLVLPLD